MRNSKNKNQKLNVSSYTNLKDQVLIIRFEFDNSTVLDFFLMINDKDDSGAFILFAMMNDECVKNSIRFNNCPFCLIDELSKEIQSNQRKRFKKEYYELIKECFKIEEVCK